MAVKNIVIYPDPLLRKRSDEVVNIDQTIKKIIEDMKDTMYSAPGIGLAAPQIGENKRIILCDIGEKRDGSELIVLINPEIVESEGVFTFEEGCLSVPGFTEKITRKGKLLVRGWDLAEKEREIEAEDLLAVVFQHEIDHLNGKLFIDHLSHLKKELFKKWMKKQKNNKQN
ncbi:MAG: peptide deformylase [Deltaproteobacteria bacterium]|nr:peptide deformylase [Deltaproteobacteria bacterium]RLA90579.1 MAG: peptide deformylase [Deltaproteobacteria bacterium]